MKARFFLLLAVCGFSNAQEPLPLGFLPNSGDFPPQIRFVRHTTDFGLHYVTRDSLFVVTRLRVQIAGIDTHSQPTGITPSKTIYNIYRGNDPAKWQPGTPTFDEIMWPSAFPGVNIVLRNSTVLDSTGTSLGRSVLRFSLAAGIDASFVRLRVLDNGSSVPVQEGSVVRFAGGRINEAVFSVAATQGDGASTIGSRLKIESADTLSFELTGRNPAQPTTVEVTFPNFDINRPSAPGAHYYAGEAAYPIEFNAEGQSIGNCGEACRHDAIALRVDDQGSIVWLTQIGASGLGTGAFSAVPRASVTKDALSVTGTTAGKDFPGALNSPLSGADPGGFLTLLEMANGRLRSSLYAGLPAGGIAWQHIVSPNGDVAIGGSYYASGQAILGFVEAWRPPEKQLLFQTLLDSRPISITYDASGNLYFTSQVLPISANSPLQIGELDPAGNRIGQVISIAVPANNVVLATQLTPIGGNDVLVTYQVQPPLSSLDSLPSSPDYIPTSPSSVARVSFAGGGIVWNRSVANQGRFVDAQLTPQGNLKLLIKPIPPLRTVAPTEATTLDAPMAAACLDTSYFAIFNRAGDLVHGTYVPSATFDFAANNEPAAPTAANIACFSASAGRMPSASTAPGELITITGGGFGPANVIYTAPDSRGLYPMAAEGFRVRIGGIDAPIVALARGLIAAQTPFDLAGPPGTPTFIEVFDGNARIGPIPLQLVSSIAPLPLFDTGDRNNSTGLPALAAVNQDGSINSTQNPAAVGSYISVYGTGLGRLSPTLVMGGLNPIPPAGPLSTPASPLINFCRWCSEVSYLGSAPGLSTSVVQANLRLRTDIPGTGVRPVVITLDTGTTLNNVSSGRPAGVVFVK